MDITIFVATNPRHIVDDSPSWPRLNAIIGDPIKFSLEERLFNSICLITTTTLFIEIFLNYYMGLTQPALLCVFGTLCSILFYYLCRYKRQTKIAIRSFAIIANLIFFLNYFFNAGIYGPNLVIFCLILLMTIVVVPKEEFIIWTGLSLVTAFGLLIFEFWRPDLIPNVYKSDLAKTIDFAVTYVVAAAMIIVTISFIRGNYDRERTVVSSKNKEIEQQNVMIVAQNKTLETLNSEKAKLFSIVAHDIRSPLSSILGYLEILTESELTEDENNRIKRSLLQITKDTSEMLANILAWSKSQLDGTKAEIVAINVKDVIENGLSLEKSAALRKSITFEVNVTDEIVIAADLNMFKLVIRNLVNNALKFTPVGGTVSIFADTIDNNCVIKIKDNGVGIAKAEQENLFKLKALSTFGTNNEKGVGLGLLLCKDFTELQDGEIFYEASDDAGSTFSISFNLYSTNKGKAI